MNDVDIAIVGAGAAGLAAAMTARDAGRTFAVIEAKDRIGGRAFTNTQAIGMPWDEGCHWLHSASVNPFREIADRLGFAYEARTTRAARQVHLGDRWADEAECGEAKATVDAAFGWAEDTGRSGGADRPAADGFNAADPWTRLARHWLTLLSSVVPEENSCRDLAAYRDTGENYPVRDGYGALVAANASGIPATLSTPVTAIDIGADRVMLETPAGRLRARAAIVTVPTNVIAAGAIRFRPALPDGVAEAFANCPCGVAEKAVLFFDRPIPDLPDTTYLDTMDRRDEARPPINFTLNPFGRPMAIGQLCGDNAAHLLQEGPEAMADFALAALVDAFGSDLHDRVVSTAATAWTPDPFIRGAYSAARPGHAGARAIMAEPVADRLWFAGEAVSADFFSTCHGAHLSGIAQAEHALAALS